MRDDQKRRQHNHTTHKLFHKFENQVKVPGHVLVRRNLAALGLPLVDHPAEEGVCGVVDTAGVPFDADPHLEDVYLRQGPKTPRLEVGRALLV